MYPAVRVQSELHLTQDEVSRDSGVVCTASEDKARQEFKLDADVNVMLARHGIVPRREYGVADFTLDVTQAHIAVRDVVEGFERLPKAVQEKYGSMRAVLEAIANGEPVDLTGAEASPPAPAGGEGGGAGVPGGAA